MTHPVVATGNKRPRTLQNLAQTEWKMPCDTGPIEQYRHLLLREKSVLQLIDHDLEGDLYAVRACHFRAAGSRDVSYGAHEGFQDTTDVKCFLDQCEEDKRIPPLYWHVRTISKTTRDGANHIIPICNCNPKNLLSQIEHVDTKSAFSQREGIHLTPVYIM